MRELLIMRAPLFVRELPATSPSRLARAALLAGAIVLFGGNVPAAAQQPEAPAASDGGEVDPAALESEAQDTQAVRDARAAELEALRSALDEAAAQRRALDEEIARLADDRARLAQALIDTTARIRGLETRAGELEERLSVLLGSEAAIRRSLESRRDVIVEVLAALQRMGRRPPPAVLVRPEDILAAVRTSMLLGSVVPELRAETEALALDLEELVRLREAIATDRATLAAELEALASERTRLTALVEARQARLAAARENAAAERARTASLAREAATLEDLIAGMEREIAAARDAASAARAASEARLAETRARFEAAAFRDPARLSPAIPFDEARGALPRPVSGETLRAFGAPDGYGGRTQGISLSTRPGEIVTAPADGWVAFAGPFRSFERLLIINAGEGYYLLLAGMETITVEVGQFVLAGEPVGTMGAGGALSPIAGALETSDPVLYVELKKDGGSIDPSPWWQETEGQEVRG
ncbi:murein hydrolase activator EnvC family protein [Salinarimonas ramus]|uniref:Membrane protein n=1 Tax=Salinarimonas ramus TaxID=690164 RepID=A0A917V957_9HYPH|nr:peptidoglycan DD-metalloendopeptidase family protein [Salinarimonas ramus]GGK52120.1 membrane protein [Salinarimonas ramus]